MVNSFKSIKTTTKSRLGFASTLNFGFNSLLISINISTETFSNFTVISNILSKLINRVNYTFSIRIVDNSINLSLESLLVSRSKVVSFNSINGALSGGNTIAEFG